jgi:hypothetical protein
MTVTATWLFANWERALQLGAPDRALKASRQCPGEVIEDTPIAPRRRYVPSTTWG